MYHVHRGIDGGIYAYDIVNTFKSDLEQKSIIILLNIINLIIEVVIYNSNIG